MSYCIINQLYISQVMDSQVGKETLNKLLENDMVSLSGGELGINLLGPDLHAHYQEDAHHKTFLNTG